MTLLHGEALQEIRALPDCSIDSVVTDPPYGLALLGKRWDYDVPSVEIWAECLRVLKPGGHLLAFAGTRTQHRMAVRIEDAGFEIRDMIAWVYGSGFPKSLDVSKAIDRAAGHWRGRAGVALHDDARRSFGQNYERTDKGDPITDAARQWNGYGTALKPALEPITIARKPLAGTVAENVLAHGTGAINVDGCRVACGDNILGRWPANLIHDGGEDVLALFPLSVSGNSARFFYCAKASKSERGPGNTHPTVKPVALMRYLVRLVTPSGGTVLDPFMGSGTTGLAATAEGLQFVGIEREDAYLEIARRRLTRENARG